MCIVITFTIQGSEVVPLYSVVRFSSLKFISSVNSEQKVSAGIQYYLPRPWMERLVSEIKLLLQEINS